MRKWIISSVVVLSLASLFFIVSPGKSRLKSYYNGDAISYQGSVYIASTNTGSLEVFKLNGTRLDPIAKLKAYNARFNSYDDFYDVKLALEGNGLYAYAVSNYTLYKYEVGPSSLNLIAENKNTYWEWYNRVDIFGDELVTISAKGINVFTRNLEAVVRHDFSNKNAPYNITSSNPNYILSVSEEKSALEVYDKESRSIKTEIPLNFKHEKGNRQAYQDAAGYIYVVDDYYAKKFDLAGKLLASFKHLDYQGFDMVSTNHSQYVYFSNGVGIVKLDKNMKEVAYTWTGHTPVAGGWAMGLSAVYNNGDKLVVFNNTSIAVYDANLNKIAHRESNERSDEFVIENLYLKLDKPRAAVNSAIEVSGGGFFANEALSLSFGNDTISAKTDANGRFATKITVPILRKGAHDIKVEGLSSKLHYSISFQVE